MARARMGGGGGGGVVRITMSFWLEENDMIGQDDGVQRARKRRM